MLICGLIMIEVYKLMLEKLKKIGIDNSLLLIYIVGYRVIGFVYFVILIFFF